jgi:hypothetical protein
LASFGGPTRIKLSPAKYGCSPLDERLNAFFEIFAAEDTFLDFRNVVDRRPFSAPDKFQSSFRRDLNSDRRIFRDRFRDLHGALDLLACGHDLLYKADLGRGLPVATG